MSNTPSVPQTHNELVQLAAGNYVHFTHNRGQVIAHTTILARAMDSPKKFSHTENTQKVATFGFKGISKEIHQNPMFFTIFEVVGCPDHILISFSLVNLMSLNTFSILV